MLGFLKKARLKVTAIIIEKREDGFNIREERAGRFIGNDGKEYYVVGKTKTEAFPLSTITTTNKILLYSPEKGVLLPVKNIKFNVSEHELELILLTPDQKRVIIEGIKKANMKWQKKQTTLEKYLPIITIFAVGIVIVMLLYITMKNLTPIMKEAVAVGRQIVQAKAQCAATTAVKAATNATTPVW